MPDLKAHPAFKHIDWVEISSPDFTGAVKLMAELEAYEKEFNEAGGNIVDVPKRKPLPTLDTNNM